MTRPANPLRYFNSSPEVIRLVVMMYVKYPLSLRNVEDLLAEVTALVGVELSHSLATEVNADSSCTHVFARQSKQQLALAVARHTGNAHHLACAHLQVHAIQVNAKRVVGF